MSILVITPSAVGHVSEAQYSQNPRATIAAITARPSPISHGLLRNEPKFISENIHRTAYTNAIESGKRSISDAMRRTFENCGLSTLGSFRRKPTAFQLLALHLANSFPLLRQPQAPVPYPTPS